MRQMTDEDIMRANDMVAALRTQREAALDAALRLEMELGSARRALAAKDKEIEALNAKIREAVGSTDGDASTDEAADDETAAKDAA